MKTRERTGRVEGKRANSGKAATTALRTGGYIAERRGSADSSVYSCTNPDGRNSSEVSFNVRRERTTTTTPFFSHSLLLSRAVTFTRWTSKHPSYIGLRLYTCDLKLPLLKFPTRLLHMSIW